jgi:hypothetical protein
MKNNNQKCFPTKAGISFGRYYRIKGKEKFYLVDVGIFDLNRPIFEIYKWLKTKKMNIKNKSCWITFY